MNFWLLKSEPSVFSFADLQRAPASTTSWEGVRNYAARNFLRAMKTGDRAFFYHSNAEPNAIVGIVEVVREAYPDPVQFVKKSDYYDARSKREDPLWSTVDVRALEPFARPVTLAELRGVAGLEKMELLRKGSRLSVTPVTAEEWRIVRALGGVSASAG
ncbi:MAG: EVE domain-containing protein [Gemmatimonadaceae bacterium]|nr:EVE domain-containing protein [Gemmatimonadaceae bacterium]NUQ91742.1 EVE domain-containing protein [Gemmatimonadaceae bacterium]NUR18760.1 EVE domain-containing protein [Gemmatimonadaceae bacterium]NUS97774.1 EVE domain-containing protein [Gemmatimonadaceae bacterium]